jgi:hypothetical protein
MWAALLALAACSDDMPASETGSCVVGQAVVCACDNGTRGAQLCGRDGVYGGCFCMGPAPAFDGGAAGTPASGTAGSSAGAGSAAGSSGGKADSGAGGRGGNSAGGGGSAGKAGGSGAAGATGSGGAGRGGTGGTGGTSGAGSGGAGTTPYSRCNTGSLCADGSLCANLDQGSINEVGYCAPRCEASDEQEVGECPQPDSGQVEALCIPIANLCLLDECSDDARCPRGMMCSRTSSGPGSQQSSCVYPR